MQSPNKKTKKLKKQSSQLEKIERRNILEQQRRLKPGECNKYIKVLIDPEFITGSPGSKITSVLVDMNLKYEIRNHKISRIILWERLEQQFLVNSHDSNNEIDKIVLSDKANLEKHVLYLIHPEELILKIKSDSLCDYIGNIKKSYEDSVVSLLIYGFKKYCKQNSSAIKRNEFEKSLTELQIIHNCSYRLIETPDELAQTIGQFSKSVAEIPFKKQQFEKFENLNLFLENDNKDCVRVDGNAGLLRLWQQHLTRLPQVTLETTEAIISEYSRPKSLFDAYENSSNPSQLLADLRTRRGGHPLTSVRRVGPELSRKIYTLYTSLDGNEIL